MGGIFARTDTHTHTTASDSTVTPSELMAQAADLGLTAIAVTDHDTIDGWEEAARAVSHTGVALLRGMEISAHYHGITVHILGYLFDPENPYLVRHMERVRESRLHRAQEMVARLSKDLPLHWENVVAVTPPGATIGRPHIADALVAEGIVKNRNEAFASYLADSSPYYVPYYAPEAVAVIGWIREAGGKAVFAHPAAAQRGKMAPPAALEEFAQAGLFGVEIDHPENAVHLREPLWQRAQSFGLARFGASDYHGLGKTNRLGEYLTAPSVVEDLVAGTHLEVIRP
ncbi:metal-dependent phosphoesterase [Actinobaculum suis]|uniref:PHP domain-containing protein n=1 Tax=Actinobaculum suis TaxID=1657 RepID=UPI00066FF138|nr:PHP domain-containing protein [Actinobaculum suis]KMY23484.1 metal-dependent phosphoesterase [Actinobaculum suis]